MSVIALAMIAGLHLLEKADQEKIALLMSNESNEKKALFDKIIEFKSKSLENFVYDYTYWDEMVRFVKSGNKLWAEENIDASIPTFNIDIAWVYRTDLSVTYSTNRIGVNNLEKLPLSKDVLEKIVSKGPFCHFFLFTDPGLMEINGASIHPTFDQDRKTPPQGYFFVGRLWTKTYQKEVSGLLGMDIRLTPPGKEQPVAPKEDLKNFIITNTIPLKGWDDTHIANVISTSEINIAKSLNEQSNIQYLISIAYLIVVLIFLSFVLFRLINRPLNLLSRSLAKNNPDLIKRLAKQKNEFGNLAVMIGEFFNQKNQLEKDIAERTRTEEVLRESEEKYRLLAESSSEMIYVVGKDGRVTYVNGAAALMFKTKSQELVGKHLSEIFPKDHAQQNLKFIKKVFTTKKPIFREENQKFPSGEIWLDVRLSPIIDKNGEVTGVLGLSSDITVRKLAEDMILEERTLLKTLIDNLPSGIFVKDKDYRKIISNPTHTATVREHLKYLGMNPDIDILDKTDFEIFPKELAEQFFIEDQKVIRDGHSIINNVEFGVRANGEKIWLLVSKVPLRDKDGSIIGMIGITNNITDRKKVEDQLLIKDFAVESSVSAIVLSDLQGKIIYVNNAYVKMWGYSNAKELIGKHAYEFAESSKIVDDAILAVQSSKEFVGEEMARKKDGTLFYVQMSANIVKSHEGIPLCIMASFIDITERKRAEETLKESEERFRNIYENMTIGMYRTTPDGQIVMCNSALIQMLGYASFEELAQRNLEKEGYEPKYDRKMFRQKIEKDGKIHGLESAWMKKDGSFIYVSESARVIRDEAGKVLYYEGTVEDISDRKQAEQALIESEEKYRLLAESSPEMIYVVGRDGRVTYVNGVAASQLRADPHELIGKHLSEIFPKDQAQRNLESIQNVFATKKPVSHEVLQKFSTGEIWLDVRLSPVIDNNGEVVGILGLSFDITDRKQAEEELHISEERMRDIIFSVGEWVWEVDENGKYTYSSQKGQDFLGYALEDVIGKTPFDFMPQEEAKRVKTIFSEIVLNKTPIRDLENWNIRKDGKKICLLTNGVPVFDKDGNLRGYRGVDKDITGRKRTEKILIESEERYRTLIDNSNDLIQSVAPDGHLLFVNPNWRHVLGYSEEEISNLNLFDIIHPDYQEHCYPLLERISRGEDIPHIEVTFVAKEGRPVFLEGSATPRLMDGKVIATQSFFHDVTERKRAEEALRESEKNYRELIDGMNETVWVIDFQGNLIDVNKTATEILGYSKEELLTIGLCGIDTSLKKKDIRALAKSMPVDKLQIFETSHTTKDGRTFPVEVYSSLVTYQGKQAILSIARDITERKEVDKALRSINERLRVLHQISETVHESLEPDVIFKRITDAVVKSMGFSTALVLTLDEKEENFKVRSLTSSKSYLSGINKILRFPLMKLVVPASEIIEGIKNAASTSDMIITNHLSEIVHPPLNKSVCNALQKLGDSKSYILIPLILEDKLIGGMIVSSTLEQVPKTDIDMLSTFASTVVQAITNADLLAKTNRAKEQTQQNLKEKEILLRELYHRTKNNMQVISAMLRLKARSEKEQKISEVFKEIENKILSMALVHQKLYESKDLSHLNLKEYFSSLLPIFQKGYGESMNRISIQTDMEDLNVLIDTATPLGLVFNELISNIIKHAFPGKTKGKIRIGLHLNTKKEIVLEISDNGVGFPKGFDSKKDIHLGLETVIDLIEYQLGGKIYFKSQNGLHCRIVIKEDRYKPRV